MASFLQTNQLKIILKNQNRLLEYLACLCCRAEIVRILSSLREAVDVFMGKIHYYRELFGV
jgi:hypothetical protein